MKKFIFPLLISVIFSNSSILCSDYDATTLSDSKSTCALSIMLPVMDVNESKSENGFELDDRIVKKHLATANFFQQGLVEKSNNVETNLVTYETTIYGVNVHIGWYVDGYIITALDGTEKGKQIIVVNEIITGISYDCEQKKDHFTHKYTWGKVYSYQNSQTIKSK